MIKNKRSKPSLNSALNMFVSSLNAAIGSSSVLSKVKLSLKKKKCVKTFLVLFLFFIEEGLRFPGPIRFFGGPIRFWTDRQYTNQTASFNLAVQ